MKKKCLFLLLAIAAMMSLLAGCSMGTPTATDIIAKSQKAPMDNYHMEGSMDFSIKLTADGEDMSGLSFEIPVSADFDIDTVEELAHGEATMKISIMGSSEKMKMEFYLDGDDMYACQDGEWSLSESNTDFAVQDTLAADCFADADVIYDKDAGTYTITNSLKAMLENKDFREAMEDCFDIAEDVAGSVDIDELMGGFENGKVVVVFDAKTYNMLRFTVEDIKIKTSVSEDGVDMDLSLEMGYDLEFSKFGEIDVDDVTVPKSVKNSVSDSINNADWEFGLDMGNETEGSRNTDSLGNSSSDIGASINENASVTKQGADVLGALNGVAFVNGCGNWDSTFGADGWVLDESSDGEYSFVVAENSKYKGADLYVTSLQSTTAALANSTIEDLKANGFYGYNIDVSYSDNKPNMTWNGLTFGTTAEEIQAAYGTPYSTYQGSLYTSYDYEISDDITLTFYVYGADGLQEVDCRIYNF